MGKKLIRLKPGDNDQGLKSFCIIYNALVECIEYTYDTTFDMARDEPEDDWLNELAKSAAVAKAWIERFEKEFLS